MTFSYSIRSSKRHVEAFLAFSLPHAAHRTPSEPRYTLGSATTRTLSDSATSRTSLLVSTHLVQRPVYTAVVNNAMCMRILGYL